MEIYRNQIKSIEDEMEKYLKRKSNTSSVLTFGGYSVDLQFPRQHDKTGNRCSNWTDDGNIFGMSGVIIGGKYELDGDFIRRTINSRATEAKALGISEVSDEVTIGQIKGTSKELQSILYRIQEEHKYIKNSVGYEDREYFRKDVNSTEGKKFKAKKL
jgi:hypothetical protein